MNKSFKCFIFLCLTCVVSLPGFSQKSNKPENRITSSDLESYVSFLAAPELKGRMNGEEGLDIAGQYLASQAKLLGLKPANGNSWFQPYPVIQTTMDPEKSSIKIIPAGKDTITLKETFLQILPTGPSDLKIEGEVVFAGYGIKIDKYKYNDFDSLQMQGKIVLIMDRAPMTADGKKCLFEEQNWMGMGSFQMKLMTIFAAKPKAVLFVNDPKSGFSSFEQSVPGLAGFLKSSVRLAGKKEEPLNPFMAGMPKVMFIPRSIADALLEGTGHTLDELQKSIDETFKPHSFAIKDKQLSINEVTLKKEKTLRNVAAYIEGSDPVLKNEYVLFSGHYDHIGGTAQGVNFGADDDASGCAAILSVAEAFASMKKKPARSVVFLWVSGEEIGLFGSEWYVEHPLFPLEKTVADLNMDMIGRIKEAADSTSATPMSGPQSVFVITDGQSSDLRKIADEEDMKSALSFDYSLSGRDHPLQLFSRSDHFNFVKKDIPVLFFTTGLHSDYHTPRDVVEKISFSKMELIAKTVYHIGLDVADRRTRINVDKPYSSWGKSK